MAEDATFMGENPLVVNRVVNEAKIGIATHLLQRSRRERAGSKRRNP
jgi:hypothetical protein